MTMSTPPDDRLDGPVHAYFELTYANYEVTPRALAQSMPVAWQQRWVACQRELREAFAHIQHPEAYEVRPAREKEYWELSDAEMRDLEVTVDANVDPAPVYYDRDGREHAAHERVLIPVSRDPVPHYNRGRTFVEPRLPEPVASAARYLMEHEQATADPDPMPVFVLKAKDVLAVGTMYYYQRDCRGHGLVEQAVEVGKAIEEMDAWQRRNLELVKLPDHVHVPATGASS